MAGKKVTNWVYATGRTVLVGYNSTDHSYRTLKNIMVNTGIMTRVC